MKLENRVPPPVVLVGIGLAMWPLAGMAPVWPASMTLSIFAGLLLVLGVLVIALGANRFRAAGTTIDPTRPERAAALVVDGIYRHTRNPMYLGFALILLAWAMHLRSGLALAGPVVFVLYIGRFQIVPEERALRKRFGSAFEAYVTHVRRWM